MEWEYNGNVREWNKNVKGGNGNVREWKGRPSPGKEITRMKGMEEYIRNIRTAQMGRH